jgi:hypothetical protein
MKTFLHKMQATISGPPVGTVFAPKPSINDDMVGGNNECTYQITFYGHELAGAGIRFRVGPSKHYWYESFDIFGGLAQKDYVELRKLLDRNLRRIKFEDAQSEIERLEHRIADLRRARAALEGK